MCRGVEHLAGPKGPHVGAGCTSDTVTNGMLDFRHWGVAASCTAFSPGWSLVLQDAVGMQGHFRQAAEAIA